MIMSAALLWFAIQRQQRAMEKRKEEKQKHCGELLSWSQLYKKAHWFFSHTRHLWKCHVALLYVRTAHPGEEGR